jgi:glyoxylase-like metal-dependent hydrolase (beta-lactamase superfamily II)
LRQACRAKPLVLLAVVFAVAAHLCISFSKDNEEPVKLANGVYARVVSPDGNAVGNSGFVILDRSVLVFDTHFTPEAGRSLAVAIRAITDKPVRYVVNSHAHPDHTHGNQAFPDAQVLSSTVTRREVLETDIPSLNRTIKVTQSQLENLRRDMKTEADAAQLQRMIEQIRQRQAYLDATSRLKIVVPVVTIDDSLIIREGKKEVQILFLGAGHTDGDVIAFLPAMKIAFLGDLFFNDAIPNVQDALLLPWMETLAQILKLDADKFVPGHGPVGTRQDVERFLRYFEELRSLVQTALEQGESVEEATKDVQLPPKYASYRFQNFFASNVQKMYAELKALQLSRIPAEGPQRPDSPKTGK